MAPSRDCAVWNADCDCILIETLEDQKANGRMTSNSSWHKEAWTATELALSGTELSLGGIKKTAQSCHDRWTAVCLPAFRYLANSFIYYILV